MKKLITLIVLALVAAPAFAEEFSIGLKAGYSKADASNIYIGLLSLTEENKLPGFAGIEFTVQDYISEDMMMGLKIGAEGLYPLNYRIESASDYVQWRSIPLRAPATLFLRIVPYDSAFSFWFGGGATYVYVFEELSYSMSGSTGKETGYSDGFFGHIKAGLEWRLCSWFSLGLDGGYNFPAKINGKFLSTIPTAIDMSGFEGSLTTRFYF